jgi:hypothetical protein
MPQILAVLALAGLVTSLSASATVGAENCGPILESNGQVAVRSKSALEAIPAELQDFAIESHLAQLHRSNMGWALPAVRRMRMMGMPEETIRQEVRKSLNKFLDYGRKNDLSNQFRGMSLLEASPTARAETSKVCTLHMSDFVACMNLQPYLDMIQQFKTGQKLPEITHYEVSLSDAFELAFEINDKALAGEIILHMLKLGKFEDAAKVAARIGDDNSLIKIGMLALGHFYLNDLNRLNPNYYLRMSIGALSQVTGDKKAQAAKILELLGDLLVHPAFLKATAIKTGVSTDVVFYEFFHHALRALIYSSPREAEGSGHVPSQNIRRKVLAIVERNQNSPHAQDYRLMDILKAVGASDILNRMAGQRLLNAHNHSDYSVAHQMYLAAGNFRAAAQILEKYFDGQGQDWFVYSLLLKFQEVGDLSGIHQIMRLVKAKAATSASEQERWEAQRDIEMIERALSGKSLKEPDRAKEMVVNDGSKAQWWVDEIAQENRIRLTIASSMKLSIEQRRQIVQQALELMRSNNSGQLYAAFRLFLEARFRPGLIQTAKKISQIDPINSIGPLYGAILLPGNPIEEAELMKGQEELCAPPADRKPSVFERACKLLGRG